MNEQNLQSVSITIGSTMYGRFEDLPNTVSHDLAEFIDNALQSYRDNKSALFELDSDYILKSVDSIKFTNVNNLFSHGSKERQALVDLTGTDAPEAFSIEAKYNNHKIKKFLQRLFTAKNNYEISDLVICGRDDKNFNFIYNVDTFSRKIDIDCCREEHSGKFDSKNVKENLLKFIENER